MGSGGWASARKAAFEGATRGSVVAATEGATACISEGVCGAVTGTGSGAGGDACRVFTGATLRKCAAAVAGSGSTGLFWLRSFLVFVRSGGASWWASDPSLAAFCVAVQCTHLNTKPIRKMGTPISSKPSAAASSLVSITAMPAPVIKVPSANNQRAAVFSGVPCLARRGPVCCANLLSPSASSSVSPADHRWHLAAAMCRRSPSNRWLKACNSQADVKLHGKTAQRASPPPMAPVLFHGLHPVQRKG